MSRGWVLFDLRLEELAEGALSTWVSHAVAQARDCQRWNGERAPRSCVGCGLRQPVGFGVVEAAAARQAAA